MDEYVAISGRDQWGVRTERGWLAPTTGPCALFFTFSPTPVFPFRTKAGANAVASDWVKLPFDVQCKGR